MDKKYILLAVAVIAIVVVIGVYASGYGQTQTLKIATTTSLEDTGLLAVLETEYEKKYPNTDVQFIAAGTGQALEYGKKGDVDLVMVHAKTSEEKFIADGFGTNRTIFAYNYFYIVGPANDPANINGSNATSAFTKIGTDGAANPTEVMFVSRGDNSGTNTRELQIWNKTDLNYTTEVQGQPWYIESGKGMGDTLILANEKSAYTLSDSGTYLAFKGNLTLSAFVTQGKDLLNVYSMIPINPAKFPDVNSEDAQTWIAFVTSAEGQKIIGEYGVDKYGQQLFIPIAGQPEPTS
jgi:tungstate transport system substrate-binding protein